MRTEPLCVLGAALRARVLLHLGGVEEGLFGKILQIADMQRQKGLQERRRGAVLTEEPFIAMTLQ